MNENLHNVLRLSAKIHIRGVLIRHNWNKAKTAKALGIGLSTLYKKIAELKIEKI